jgi:hypothetical protein
VVPLPADVDGSSNTWPVVVSCPEDVDDEDGSSDVPELPDCVVAPSVVESDIPTVMCVRMRRRGRREEERKNEREVVKGKKELT